MAKKLTFEQMPAALAQLLEDVAEIKKMLKAKPAPAKAEKASDKPTTLPGEIDIDRVCVILKRSKATVYALVKSGKLQSRKQGNKLFFIKEEVEAYAASPKKSTRGRKKATPAAKAKANPKSAPAAEVKSKAGGSGSVS